MADKFDLYYEEDGKRYEVWNITHDEMGAEFCEQFPTEEVAIEFARNQQACYGGDHRVYKCRTKIKKVWG